MKPSVICCLIVALAVSACDKPVRVDTCVAPGLAPPKDPASYLGQRQLAHACLKTAAYAIARNGAAVATVADAVLNRCEGKEADEIAALKKSGPVYDYQVAQIHEELVHGAKLAAVEARSKGCGLPAGQQADTMLDSKP